MASLKFDATDSLASIIKKIQKSDSDLVTVEIASESPLLKNPLNLKILEQIASESGKEIELTQSSPTGQIEKVEGSDLEENLGFVEEGSDPEVIKEAETLEEAVQTEVPPTESETLSLTPEPELLPTAESDVPKFGIQTPAAAPFTPPIPDEVSPEGVNPGLLPIKGFKLPGFNLNSLRKIKWTRRNLLISGGVLGAILILFALFFLLPSAEVTLFVAAQNLEKAATVSATPRLNEIDVNSASIPLTTVEVKESGSLSAKVFGKKNVGDPARGKVTIRNYSTSTEKSLPKGVSLKVVGKSPVVEFSLDRAVTVPTGSASSTVDSSGRKVNVIDPGRLDVDATANKIGTEGNIAVGTRLAISNEGLDVVDSVAAVDFSGGNSKEVTVVAATDRSELLATLSAQLTQKAKEEVKTKLSEGQKLPDGGVDISESKKIFSKDIDQEATDLNLNLEIVARASVYNDKDLAKLLAATLKGEVAEGYKISEKDTEATAEVLKVNDDKTVSLLAKIKSKLVPDLNIDEITKNIKGKSLGKAKEYLKTIKNIDDVEIKLNPTFLNFLKIFPTNAKRIKIDVVSKNQ